MSQHPESPGTTPRTLDIVIPVFNEEDCLPEMLRRLELVARSLTETSGIATTVILVNDGSTDGSVEQYRKHSPEHMGVKLVNLRRNFGHQLATSAGIHESSGDVAAILDADLQDPPELLGAMIERLASHNVDVVYGKRVSRRGESRYKLMTAAAFYRFIRWSSEVDVPLDAGDFRVMTRPVCDALNEMPEHHRVLRVMVPWLGFAAAPFEYERAERFAGETKFPTRKMVRFAAHAVFSFSVFPVRLLQTLTATLLAIGVGLLLVSILSGILMDESIVSITTGWNTVLASLVLGGVSIVGGYTQRIQTETQRRPLYTIRAVEHRPPGSQQS